MSEADGSSISERGDIFYGFKKGGVKFVIKILIFRFDFLDKGVRPSTCMYV